jgi:hypothetical protein
VCRFINPDVVIDNRTVLGANLFAYCWNNPIISKDSSGNFVLVICGITLTAKATAALVALVAATVIVLTPGFMETWANMFTDIMEIIVEGLETIGDAMDITVTWITQRAKSIAQSIGDSFANVKSVPKYRNPTEVHHLVAKAAKNAQRAAEILRSVFDMGVEDYRNKLRIKTGLHRRIHTNAYYGWANSVVISAYRAARGDRVSEISNVCTALNVIRAMVAKLNEVAPF